VKLFYDTEFIDDGRTIDLVSIGVVAEDGQEYYAVSSEFDRWKFGTNAWLIRNVLPSLPTTWDIPWVPTSSPFETTVILPGLDVRHPDVKTRGEIADDVSRFILSYEEPELWASYGAYDHVALAQLFGPMTQLPDGIPMYTNDLKQECNRLGNPRVPQQKAGQHNALEDARHNVEIYRFLTRFEYEQLVSEIDE
jgi:hypothetical protein